MAVTGTAVNGYLADTSALSRMDHQEVVEVVEPLIRSRRVAVCAPVELELRHAARSAKDFRAVVDELFALPSVPVDEAAFRRALEVQESLAAQGRLRSVPLAELLVAAVAEVAGLVVLHYDEAFDAVAGATGQPTEWVVEPGSAE